MRKTGWIFGCIILLMLSACRSSPVLVEELYTQTAEEIDSKQEMLESEETGTPDEQFHNEMDPEAQTQRDTQIDEGVHGDITEADQAVSVEAGTNHQETNNQRSESPAPSASSAPSAASPSPSPSPTPTSTPTPSVSPSPEPVSEPQWRQITDATGSIVEIPEQVETVTATGASAQLVEILGGSGRLLGADAELLSSDLAQAAFADIGTISAWWSGDGSGEISQEQFSALLELRPDVCLVTSGQSSFSDSQLQQLKEAEIAVVTLYAPVSVDSLIDNSLLIGAVLGGDAEARADRYVSWVNGVISEVGGRTSAGEMTSLYVAGYDNGASYMLNTYIDALGGNTGSGLAMVYTPGKAQLATSFMAAAHVVNSSTDTTFLANKMNAFRYAYATPMFHQFSPTVYENQATFVSSSEYGQAYDLFVSRNMGSSVYYQLGSVNFPGIITADAETKTAIENNYFWQYHETDGSGYVAGTLWYCGIVGAYPIYINPQGMLNWAEYSAESPLEAYWVACKLQNAYSMDEVKEKTLQFYRDFFGIELTDQQLFTIFSE